MKDKTASEDKQALEVERFNASIDLRNSIVGYMNSMSLRTPKCWLLIRNLGWVRRRMRCGRNDWKLNQGIKKSVNL